VGHVVGDPHTGTYQSNLDVAYFEYIPSYLELHAKLNNKTHVAKLREEYMNDVIDVRDVMFIS